MIQHQLKGDKGDKGDTGPQGAVGPKGPQGDPGKRSERGLKGPQGPGGPKGDRGDKGDKGEKGEPGSDGAQGPQGQRGEKGNTGSQGANGIQGPVGPRGVAGQTGPQGPQGRQGIQGIQGRNGNAGPVGSAGPTGNTGPAGPQGITGSRGPKGEKGDKGDTGSFDKATKRQVVMVDKIFEKITYEDSNRNVKGVFQEFQFASTSSSAPFNEGHGQNLIVSRETRKEKVPNMGLRAPLKIEQDMAIGDSTTQIAFTTPQTRQDQYGMLVGVKFLAETGKALESKSASTASGGVYTSQSIKNLGSISVNGNIYHYFLVKVAPDTQSRTETTVQFNFTSSKLKNGKMIMVIFEGFTFNNFTNSDYNSANITTHFPYPHQKDFDKNKFQDVMTGDVLLAGTKQADGTVTANESLRLRARNLINAIPLHYTALLPYVAPTKNSNGWCNVYDIRGGYPEAVFPCMGTGQILITLLTHAFDADDAIPLSSFTLQYRLIIFNESQSATSEKLLDQIDYTDTSGNGPAIRRSINCFYLNRRLSYDPPASCIGFSLEFKQIDPVTPLGNESRLFFHVQQEM